MKKIIREWLGYNELKTSNETHNQIHHDVFDKLFKQLEELKDRMNLKDLQIKSLEDKLKQDPKETLEDNLTVQHPEINKLGSRLRKKRNESLKKSFQEQT